MCIGMLLYKVELQGLGPRGLGVYIQYIYIYIYILYVCVSLSLPVCKITSCPNLEYHVIPNDATTQEASCLNMCRKCPAMFVL